MSSIKQYQDKNVIVKYHPDEKVIQLQLKPKGHREALEKIEDKLKTTLTVDSTDVQSNSVLLTLGPQTQEASVHEFLQTILRGGKETGDAVDAEQEETSQVQPPMPPQPGVMPGGAPPTSPGQLPMESFNITDAYILLMENVKKPKILKEATYRTGEHWEILAQVAGKGKQQIDDKDVLSLRRTFTKKRRSSSRDKVLRALDRVARYFIRKIRNAVGGEAAQLFKERYKKIGSLTPMDYAEGGEGEMPDLQQQPAEFDPSSIDFSEFFPKDEEPQGPEEKEEEDPEEEYPEGEEESPENKYGEDEEEYPD